MQVFRMKPGYLLNDHRELTHQAQQRGQRNEADEHAQERALGGKAAVLIVCLRKDNGVNPQRQR